MLKRMLKLKDNIELKELKKFGFIVDEAQDCAEYKRVLSDDDTPLYRIIVWPKNHVIQLMDGEFYVVAGSLQTLLFDLFEAGMVEKC